jgi:glyoxylase-like metal-dependent hydrolase (beta-lactamase superfamily II)
MTSTQPWFDVSELEPGIFAIDEPHHVERVKSHLIVGAETAILIDTGMGVGNIRDVVEELTDKPVTVVNSHAHWDHIGGNHLFDEILIHPAEAADLEAGYPNERMRRWFAPERLTGPLPDGVSAETLSIPPSKASGMLHEGQILGVGGRDLEVLHCPGHSPGGVVLLDADSGILFSTDVAYLGYLYVYGGAAMATYQRSLERLAALAPVLRVLYPSHNDAVVSPDALPAMVDALRRVAAGEEPGAVHGEMRQYDFGETGVYLFPPRYEE